MQDPAEFVARGREIFNRGQRTIRDSLKLAGHALSRLDRLLQDLGRDSRRVADDAVALWRALEAASAEAEATARTTPRVALILRELARVAAVYRVFYLKAAWLAEERRQAELEELHAREAARMRQTLEVIGGGVLKIGQLLSGRADLLPAPWIAELKSLQDMVPAAPEDEVIAALAAELRTLDPDVHEPDDESDRDTIDRWFCRFDATPVAAASLAQVHRATLRAEPQREVAVKIQRPGIAEVIALDRRALAIVANLLAPLFERIALEPILEEISRSLGAELDFAREAKMIERFRRALPSDLVTIPEVIASTPRLVLMDFVEGARLTDFLSTDSARDQILERLARTTAESILLHGLVHADPHPGNFLATSAPALVMLDFGASLVLEEPQRRALTELIFALFGQNERRTHELLETLGFSAPDPAAPAQFAMEFVQAMLPKDLNAIDPRVELERALAAARRYPGIVVPGAFVQIGRALSGLGGLFMTYRPAIDLHSILMETLQRATLRSG